MVKRPVPQPISSTVDPSPILAQSIREDNHFSRLPALIALTWSYEEAIFA